ncbi:hypothetical protein N0V83_010796 [Neocucurbitaria cava]|uniref:Lysine-specific metallo-endopeptidase domain-containing protein n=1 Tax=Neocucurbitaria cava TaxID=798079 RepID=A0A9W8XZ33_9PLEO|nr:hypothetical protein N0V83_010796 [Neocucurbitaria cava]
MMMSLFAQQNESQSIADLYLSWRAVPEPSAYPWASEIDPVIKNEFKWLNWNVEDKDDERDGRKIHQAFREWHEFAKAGLQAAEKYQAKPPANILFKRWFGSPEDPDDVMNMFKNMIDPVRGEASKYTAQMVIDRVDFNTDPEKRCDRRPNMNAYTTPGTGKFHFCPHGIEKPLNSEIRCEDLDSSVSAKMRSVSATFLHETTHYNLIDETVDRTRDDASGASDCFGLNDNDKIHISQNYAWLAADAYWSAKCSKTFADPPPGTKDNDDPVDGLTQPSPAPEEPPKLPTKALSIISEVPPWYGKASQDIAWLFFATEYGQKVGCRVDPAYTEKRQEDISKPATYPGGTFDLRLCEEDCQYKNDGLNPGRLFCADKEIECKNDPAHEDGSAIDGKLDGSNYMCGPATRHAFFTCAW